MTAWRPSESSQIASSGSILRAIRPKAASPEFVFQTPDDAKRT